MMKLYSALASAFALTSGLWFGSPASAQANINIDHVSPEEAALEIPPCTVDWPEGESRDAFILQTWPDGVVPYDFDAEVSELNRGRARAAMDEIMEHSGVRFVERTSQPDYVRFRNGSGNSSSLGRRGGRQFLTMSSWHVRFIIVHELMHALGDNHEHQRPDRDDYVVINFENIEEGRAGNFSLRPLAAPEGPYDFESVMHYSRFGFSSNGLETISLRPEYVSFTSLVGQRAYLSDGDILGLRARYGTPLRSDFSLDGRVDEVDLAILLAAWGTDAIDLDGDGVCGQRDLAYLLAEWQ